MIPYLKNRNLEGWTVNCTYEMAGYVRLSNTAASSIDYRGILKTPALTTLTTAGNITVKYDVCRFSAAGPVTFRIEGAGTILSATYIDVIEDGVTYGGDSYTKTTTETDVSLSSEATSFVMTATTGSVSGMSPEWNGFNAYRKYWTRFTVNVTGATSETKIVWDTTEATETSAQLRCCIDNISIRK